MIKGLLGAAALLAASLMPGVASADRAVATANVNLRAGPSTGYPAVDVVPFGKDVRVHGCLRARSWCDVSVYGLRGWMSSNYLAFERRGRRYTGETAVRYIEAPVITFQVGDYWDRHYRARPFYRERARWERRRDLYDVAPPPPRREWRERRQRDRDWEDEDRYERRDDAGYERRDEERYERRARRDRDRSYGERSYEDGENFPPPPVPPQPRRSGEPAPGDELLGPASFDY